MDKIEQIKGLLRIYDAKLYDIWVQAPDTTEKMFAKEEGASNWLAEQITTCNLPLFLDYVRSKKLTDADYDKPLDLYHRIKAVFPEWEILTIGEQERIKQVLEAQIKAIEDGLRTLRWH